jgi:8-oxo-dGTP pyrophosphatase MutT (NUDIX family)
VGRLRRLLGALPTYAQTAWWGLAGPRYERVPLVVVQAVVLGPEGLLLSVRSDLRGWELPGGNPHPGEPEEQALHREVFEETGVRVEPLRHVGDYVRTGFRPHRARVYLCRAVGGVPRPSPETPCVAWLALDALPETLFPWYRAPIEDALAERAEPVERYEYQGVGAVLAGMRIDLRMRWRGDVLD